VQNYNKLRIDLFPEKITFENIWRGKIVNFDAAI